MKKIFSFTFFIAILTVDIYNIAKREWSIASLNEPLNRASVVSVNNKIYFAGGGTENSVYSNKVYEVNW